MSFFKENKNPFLEDREEMNKNQENEVEDT